MLTSWTISLKRTMNLHEKRCHREACIYKSKSNAWNCGLWSTNWLAWITATEGDSCTIKLCTPLSTLFFSLLSNIHFISSSHFSTFPLFHLSTHPIHLSTTQHNRKQLVFFYRKPQRSKMSQTYLFDKQTGVHSLTFGLCWTDSDAPRTILSASSTLRKLSTLSALRIGKTSVYTLSKQNTPYLFHSTLMLPTQQNSVRSRAAPLKHVMGMVVFQCHRCTAYCHLRLPIWWGIF